MFVFICAASHPLLDAMTSGGLGVALRARHRFGDSPAGRAAAVGGVVYISAFAVDDGIDKRVGFDRRAIGYRHVSLLWLV